MKNSNKRIDEKEMAGRSTTGLADGLGGEDIRSTGREREEKERDRKNWVNRRGWLWAGRCRCRCKCRCRRKRKRRKAPVTK